MKVLEVAVGAVFAPTRFSLVRVSIRDLVADGKSLVRSSGGEIRSSQKSALDFLSFLQWIFVCFSRAFLSSLQRKAPQNVEKIARLPGGEKRVKSCHLSGCHGCHGFFGPERHESFRTNRPSKGRLLQMQQLH